MEMNRFFVVGAIAGFLYAVIGLMQTLFGFGLGGMPETLLLAEDGIGGLVLVLIGSIFLFGSIKSLNMSDEARSFILVGVRFWRIDEMIRRILEMIDRKGYGLSEIQKELGIDADQLNQRIQAMTRMGYIEIEGSRVGQCGTFSCLGCPNTVSRCHSYSNFNVYRITEKGKGILSGRR